MPEGDSIASNARRLRPILEGKNIESVYGTSGSVRTNSRRMVGASVTGVRTIGKNLIVDFSTDYSLWVHLEMNGRWAIMTSGRRVPGAARVALSTSRHIAACIGAPTVEVDRTPAIDLILDRLGPDVLDPDFNPNDAVARARHFDEDPLGRVLLNQRVAAGIGNVYKSELAFLAGTHPLRPISALSDSDLAAIFARARTLLAANVGRGSRTTTGNRVRGQTYFVYQRAGEACRRCSQRIEEGRLDDRVTYWCPGCQPA